MLSLQVVLPKDATTPLTLFCIKTPKFFGPLNLPIRAFCGFQGRSSYIPGRSKCVPERSIPWLFQEISGGIQRSVSEISKGLQKRSRGKNTSVGISVGFISAPEVFRGVSDDINGVPWGFRWFQERSMGF